MAQDTTPKSPAAIKGAEHPLGEIFSERFEYVIPSYQRPYAWTDKEAGELFDDLYDFFQDEQDGAYFLGSIVLIKEERVPRAEVIDGQQRLTTLTILLAAIAYRLKGLDGTLFAEVQEYVRQPGKAIAGRAAKPRLELRRRDQPFFAETVQSFAFDKLRALDDKLRDPEDELPETHRRIMENGLLLLERVENAFQDDARRIVDFCSFMMNRCFLVVVSTPARGSAFRVFSVLNNRGLDLQHSDRIKADVIGTIPEALQDEYTEKWEDMEARTGREELEALLGHIRQIYLQERAKADLFAEFDKPGGVLDKIRAEADAAGRDPSEYLIYLIDEVLEPYAKAFHAAKKCAFSASDGAIAAEVNALLLWLNRIENTDWMPPALVFLKQGHTPADALWFFRKLERLAACLHLRGKNVNLRVRRYAPVLTALLNDPDGDGRVPALDLTDEEKAELASILDGDIYNMQARRRNYLLLRLDAFLSDGLATYEPERMTIEHVLPRTVRAGSEWARLWPDADQRKEWTHRLANLVILTRIRNSKAQNADFAAKKSAYFAGRKGDASFVLTSQVLREADWKPETVARRQRRLLDTLKEGWELKSSASEGTETEATPS